MLRRLGSHIRNQWMGALALFLVLTGGVAYAANTVFSTDIVDGEVKNPDLGTNAVRTGKVLNENLTGADIADQSGVDTCVSTGRLGQICVRGENFARPWYDALAHCGNIDLRVPTLGEALALARFHDIPNVDPDEYFWTDEFFTYGGTEGRAILVNDNGLISNGRVDGGAPIPTNETVCVTTPTN